MTADIQPQQRENVDNVWADAVHAIMRFLRLLQYRKMYVIVTLTIAIILGSLYYGTATRIYQAKAQLLVTQTGVDSVNTSSGNSLAREGLLPTYERLFSSSVVLQGALERIRKLERALKIDFHGEEEADWEDVLRRNLSARSVRRTNIIELRYLSKSAAAAEAIVNAMVESYLQFMEKHHKDLSVQIVDILEKERVDLETKVRTERDKLTQLRRRTKVLGIKKDGETNHPSVQRVTKLNESLIEAQKMRVQLQATMASLQWSIRNGRDLRDHLAALEPTVGREVMLNSLGINPQFAEMLTNVDKELIRNRARLESLSTVLGPAHPDIIETRQSVQQAEKFLAEFRQTMKQRVGMMHQDQLRQILVNMIQQRLDKARAHEQELLTEYRIAEDEAIALNDNLTQLVNAERSVERMEELHGNLLNQIATIGINKDNMSVRVAVVSRAEAPEIAVSPRLAWVALLCLMGGFGFGAAIVYVLDLLDDRFRSMDEMQVRLATNVLAMIRPIELEAETGPEAIQVHVSPNSVESESFRTLRTTLSMADNELRRLAITSSEPGDGKTTVIANLSASFAQAGKRTLLIDADLRRPGLTRLFDFRTIGGLSNVLRSSDPEVGAVAQRCIVPTGIPGLDIIASGPKPPNPAELLSSDRMMDLIGWAETEYDQILIDCPPVMAASEAAVVGRAADGTMLVVQPEKNHRRMVLRAIDTLRSMRVNVLGVIANRVGRQDESSYYGYGYGYGYGYSYGYGEDDEPVAEEMLDESLSESDHEPIPVVHPTPRPMRRRAA